MEDKFEAAIQKWTEIDLLGLQKQLDKEGETIVEAQTDSVASRKELASKTRDFKKLEDNDKLEGIKTLLKAYQGEIDRLTQRARNSETAFLNVYKLLAEAPDPRPLLEASSDAVGVASSQSRLIAENAKLSEQVARYADYDTLKQKVLRLEMSNAETVAAKVKAKQQEMEAAFDEERRTWKSRETELTEQVNESREMGKELRRKVETYEEKLGEEVEVPKTSATTAISSAEMEIVTSDLEKAQRRLLDLEARNLDLRKQIEDKPDAVVDSSLEEENKGLLARLEAAKQQLQSASASAQEEAEQLRKTVQRREDETAALKARLAAQTDYDELKRELEVFRSVEFSQESEDRESLEHMLLQKNKKQQSDLTVLRNKTKEYEETIAKLTKSLQDAKTSYDEASTLNARLESDLTTTSLGSVAGSIAPSRRTTRGGPSGRLSPTSSIIGGYDRSVQSGGGGSDLLPIITQQRDRFKERIAQLEDELRKNFALVSELRQEAAVLKSDNLELYEKTRYMASHAASGTKAPTTTNTASKYRDAYEEGLTPFQQFRGRETDRMYSRLTPIERVTLALAKGILRNRITRNCFSAYVLALHIVTVMLVAA
ncbi:CASP C terminal-domain-containing protein [Yarrowia lipolytica]|uniref:Protein CASP n=1 Tax=Yarrowia lipolytica TaxID=4952 RepID=A0A371C6C7_YARLL|nr:CASP C terminal-domain-containing protein [Yarrowia lipolytica]RDW31652.1 CASP C terminal-domain-containing protein [Yarrowia lipolytica]RDW36744.1 CASP C terminal-domain-containing protein [Yarrowia lipolytica]RDW45581.1 CASP C terminal-domain-containing protein [Yarrowia lipolytica]RDW52262.1 CASP C terminal-domain-containing protein [Yarrowia lipolytica]